MSAPQAPAFVGDVQLAVSDEQALAALIRCWRVNPGLAFCDLTHPAHGPAHALFRLTNAYLHRINSATLAIAQSTQRLIDIGRELNSFRQPSGEGEGMRILHVAQALLQAAPPLHAAQTNVAVLVTAYRDALPNCDHGPYRYQGCRKCADARRADARRLEGPRPKINVSDVERYVIELLYGDLDKCLTDQEAYEVVCIAQGL